MARRFSRIQSSFRRRELTFPRALVTLATAIALALPSGHAGEAERAEERELDCKLCPPSQEPEQHDG
jgi:hypothetical protein